MAQKRIPYENPYILSSGDGNKFTHVTIIKAREAFLLGYCEGTNTK